MLRGSERRRSRSTGGVGAWGSAAQCRPRYRHACGTGLGRKDSTMTVGHDPVDEQHDDGTGEVTQVVRASSIRARGTTAAPPADAQGSRDITAELPIVPPIVPPYGSSTRSRYADPRPPGRARRRDPAPVLLRAVVWLLAFVFLVAAVVSVTVHVHPTWLAFLRNTGAAAAPSTPSSATASDTSPAAAQKMSLLSESATTVTYAVPVHTFTIAVTPIARCYVTVAAPPGSKSYLFASTVSAPKTATVTVDRTVSVVVQASARSIAIRSGSSTIGTVSTPVIGKSYVFTAVSG